jgi:hypothetical protein
MKTLLVLTIFSTLFSTLHSEDFEVYLCDTQSKTVTWAEEAEEDTSTYIKLYRLRHKVASFSDDALNFDKLIEEAIEHDSSEDPFFGPGNRYIIKTDKGDFFAVYFEYEKGSSAFNGRRAMISRINRIGHVAGVFIDPNYLHKPSGGSTFNKDLLKHFLTLQN